MLIKPGDDSRPQIDALEALLVRPDVEAQTRRRLEQELRTVRAGASGERDAAYDIEFHYAANPNWMTIHGLRIELESRVAQIDHLIINRLLDIWVCESKHFAEGVSINEHSEWVAFYGHRPYGIASPVEQNRRHVAVLADVFAKSVVPLPTRLGFTIKPKISSLVLVSNGARISRPRGRAARRVEGLDTVIKVDQLQPTIERAFDERNPAAIAKVVGRDTLETFVRRLAALHMPAQVDWTARFGLLPEPRTEPPAPPPTRHDPAPATARSTGGTSEEVRVCSKCGRRVSEAVIAYCHAHEARFGGATYCMACQKTVLDEAVT